jgi:hypothetical protein
MPRGADQGSEIALTATEGTDGNRLKTQISTSNATTSREMFKHSAPPNADPLLRGANIPAQSSEFALR